MVAFTLFVDPDVSVTPQADLGQARVNLYDGAGSHVSLCGDVAALQNLAERIREAALSFGGGDTTFPIDS